MIFYIYDNEEFINNFINNKNITLLTLNQYLTNEKNIKFNNADVCIFNLNNFNMLFLHKIVINIYLLKNNVPNIFKLENFTYIIPTNVKLYLDYFCKFSNILLPVNFNKYDFDTYYCSEKIYMSIRKRIKSKYVIESKNANLVVFDNYDELSDFSNILYKFNTKLLKQSIYDINNILNLSREITQNYELIIPENIHYTKVEFNNYDNDFKMMLKSDKIYLVIPKNTNLIKNIDTLICNFIQSKLYKVSFLVKNNNDYQLAFLYKPRRTNTYTIIDLMKITEYHHNLIIGETDSEMTLNNIFNMYNLMGQTENYSIYRNILDYDNYYYDCIIYFIQKINRPTRQYFSYLKFIRVISFWAGLNYYNLSFHDIENFYNENMDLFKQRKILLISKAITDYGGNQKTGLQIYKDLIRHGYDVKICCLTDNLVFDIDNSDIIRLNKISEVENHINNTDYELVIINKLDEMLDIVEKLNKKIIFLTHNSTDPVNKKIIEKSKYLYKILTVNYEHANIFLENNINNKIIKYINYVDTQNYKQNRSEFKFNLLYIGRISQEKNINLLINGFNKFISKNNKKIKLYIIGDGKDTINYESTENIYFLGRCDIHKINLFLQNTDYLILPSSTEGLPFAILESFNMGIPVITSNIVGCNELVFNNKTGFTFDIPDYIKYKNNYDNWDIIKHFNNNYECISNNLSDTLEKAYSINIDKWNDMSSECSKLIKSNFNEKIKLINLNNLLNENSYALITKFECDNLKKLFDIYSDDSFYNKYNLVFKIDDKELVDRLVYYLNKDIKYLIFIINNIMKEMYEENIHQIIDKNNYIKNYSVKSDIIKYKDLTKIF